MSSLLSRTDLCLISGECTEPDSLRTGLISYFDDGLSCCDSLAFKVFPIFSLFTLLHRVHPTRRRSCSLLPSHEQRSRLLTRPITEYTPSATTTTTTAVYPSSHDLYPIICKFALFTFSRLERASLIQRSIVTVNAFMHANFQWPTTNAHRSTVRVVHPLVHTHARCAGVFEHVVSYPFASGIS